LEIIIFRGLERVGVHQSLSNFGGLVTGILFAFWFNVRFNFKVPLSKRRRAFLCFISISLISVMINFIFKSQLLQLGWSYEISRLTVSGSLFLIGYFFHKKFSFADYKKVGVAVYANGVEDIKGIHEKIGSYADFIHVDIIDSSYGDIDTDPATYRLETIKAYWPDHPIHIHIMSKYPSKWIPHFKNYANVVFVHYEIDEDLSSALNQINELKIKSGVVLTMSTNPAIVKDDIIDCSNIMILSIPKPGKSGQIFDMNAVSHINLINRWSERKNFYLYIDGGVSEKNIQLLNVEGVVSGSSVLFSDNPVRQIMRLQTSSNYEQI
jgi:pentose-5-phosphate-3-epimerase/putative flippase GtrA